MLLTHPLLPKPLEFQGAEIISLKQEAALNWFEQCFKMGTGYFYSLGFFNEDVKNMEHAVIITAFHWRKKFISG